MNLRRWKPNLDLNAWLRIAAGALVVFVFFVHEAELSELRFIQQLELWAYDARLRLFMPNTMDTNVVIIDIDEKSLQAEGRFPWSRDKLAVLVRQAFDKYGAKTLGFDITFAEPDTSSGLGTLEELGKASMKDSAEFQSFLAGARQSLDYDRVFADEIGKHPVVLGFFLGGKTDRAGVLPAPIFTQDALSGKDKFVFKSHSAQGYSGNVAKLQERAAAAGHLYPAIDFDGLTRRVPMFVEYDGGYYEALSLAMLRTAMGNAPAKIVVEQVRGNQATISHVDVDKVDIPLDDRMSALVPYRGAGGVFRYVSATDVIRGTLEPDALRGKLVIVGTSAQGLNDLRATPVREDFVGVEVHANLLSGFLERRIMYKPDFMLAVSVLVVLALGVPLVILLPRLSAVTSTVAVGGLIVALVAVNLFAWKSYNFVLDIAAPITMLLLIYLLNMAWGFFQEARSRRLISGLFGTYVPKELVAEMSKNPGEYSMRGESRDMTVLFSDVRDFTSISEGLSPEELRDMMNTYLSEMTEVIQHSRGTIDKYIGDAIMAFWGAPLNDREHAIHGIESALDMQKRIRGLDPVFAKRGWPVLNIGVGLNCGEMNVGDMGSKFRRAYTVMGDRVNIASRLESLTKEYGIGILVSEDMVRAAPGFVYREIDRIVVKGRQEGISVFEPIGRQGEVGGTTVEEVDRFHRALEAYRKQRWNDAEEHFKTLRYASPESKLYKLFLKRIAHFRENPPGPTWNGTWVFTTK